MNCLERGKLSYCLVVVISSSIVSAEVPTSTGKPLSVWDAIAVALQSSPDVSIASARIRESEAKLEEIRSACYPNISIDTGYLRSNAPSVVFGKTLDQRALDFGSVNFNDPDDINNFESGATLRYGLYSPGRSQQTKAVRHGVSAARFGKTAIENNLIDAVVKAYYTVLESDEMIGTAEGSLTTIEAELKDTRVRLQGGAALETDVLSLEVRQAAAKEDLIRSQNARQLALSSMANVMGLAVDAPIQLSGEEWEPRQLPVEFESGMKDAMSLRAELQRLRERLRSSRLHEEAARKAYLPRVDVMGRGYLDADDFGYDANDGNWLVGLSVSFDVFDGHRKKARVSQAQAILSQLSSAEKKQVQGIQLEVKHAYLRYTEAQERVKVTTVAVALADKALQLIRKQFEGGAATVTRYLEAELDLTRARSRSTRAKYDLKKSMAEVGRSIGYCVMCARDALSQ